jgi:hypothetical protein
MFLVKKIKKSSVRSEGASGLQEDAPRRLSCVDHGSDARGRASRRALTASGVRAAGGRASRAWTAFSVRTAGGRASRCAWTAAGLPASEPQEAAPPACGPRPVLGLVDCWGVPQDSDGIPEHRCTRIQSARTFKFGTQFTKEETKNLLKSAHISKVVNPFAG